MDTLKENREIFESMPDAFWAGDIPSDRKKWYIPAAVAVVLIPLLAFGLASVMKPRLQLNALAEVSYRVDNGVKGEMKLSDGTTVSLNSGSSLKVLGERRVYLDGEGWFEVESDKEHPFYVETPSGISVKVTGTQFNLSNYNDEDFKVLLVKGSIELKNASNSVPLIVKPSEQVIVKRGMASKEFANLQEKQNTTAWREGVLVFDDKPFREAIPMLERWYGVSISVNSPSILEERLTGEFDTETIQEVMNVLALTHGFTYSIDHKDITLALK
jgi:ferric-dicitrate binding protein FerR (iron transport regulator)